MRMILDIFAQIFRTLWAHKLRSFLTMFGVAWGVGSLLLLVGLGEGFRSGNKRNLAEFGENIMFVFPGRAPVIASSMNSARKLLMSARLRLFFPAMTCAPPANSPPPTDKLSASSLSTIRSGFFLSSRDAGSMN